MEIVPLFCEQIKCVRSTEENMSMDNYTWFFVLFYGFGIILKVFEAIHIAKQRRQEKKLAETLDKLDKFIDKTRFLD